MSRHAGVKRSLLLGLSLLALGVNAAPRRDADLQQLRGQIQSLEREMADTQQDRDEVSDALKKAERAISDANRTLDSLLTHQRQLARSSRTLATRVASKEREIRLRRAQVANLLRERYRAGHPEAWQLWLDQRDPNQLARLTRYADYWIRAQQQMLKALKHDTEALHQLRGEAQTQADALKRIAEQQKEQQSRLLQEKAARQTALSSLSQRLADQSAQLTKLQNDEKRLTTLMTRLADLSRLREERRAPKNRKKPSAETATTTVTAAPSVNDKPAPEKTGGSTPIAEPKQALNSRFARLKGHLPRPISGDIAGRFGENRSEGSPWKGLFIRTAAGRPVQAVAAGEVVYADWIRGFGNVIIIDHGEGYMSLYGYNESLLKQPGDAITQGERIATTGASGGQTEPGLYFEIRYQGRPVNPATWIS